MSRNPKIAETMPQFEGAGLSTLSNTASAIMAARPFLRTKDATTNIVVASGGSVATINLKTVDSAGNAVRGMVDVAAHSGGAQTITATAASVGTQMTVTAAALIASAASVALAPLGWTASFCTDATTGILTATFTFSDAAAGAFFVIRYGAEELVVAVPVT